MTTKQREQPAGNERQDREKLDARIGERVLQTLGRPPRLFKVQVRRLWEDRYRVNVFIGEDATFAKIEHSYFLAVDGGGLIVESIPKIMKRY